MEKKKFKLNNEGFSLIELIIVIAIMAILVGALAPRYVKYIEQANEAKDKQALGDVYTVVVTSVAEYEASGKPAPTWPATTELSSIDTGAGTLGYIIQESLGGTLSVKLKSKKADADSKIYVTIDADKNVTIKSGSMKVSSKGYEDDNGVE